MFTFSFGFAIFNIITAIIVEKAVTIASPDIDEELDAYHKQKVTDSEQFRLLCQLLDLDTTGTISLPEIESYMKIERFADYMSFMGLDIDDVRTFFMIVAGGIDKRI